jgi:hypothetical protein
MRPVTLGTGLLVRWSMAFDRDRCLWQWRSLRKMQLLVSEKQNKTMHPCCTRAIRLAPAERGGWYVVVVRPFRFGCLPRPSAAGQKGDSVIGTESRHSGRCGRLINRPQPELRRLGGSAFLRICLETPDTCDPDERGIH